MLGLHGRIAAKLNPLLQKNRDQLGPRNTSISEKLSKFEIFVFNCSVFVRRRKGEQMVPEDVEM